VSATSILWKLSLNSETTLRRLQLQDGARSQKRRCV